LCGAFSFDLLLKRRLGVLLPSSKLFSGGLLEVCKSKFEILYVTDFFIKTKGASIKDVRTQGCLSSADKGEGVTSALFKAKNLGLF